jgi:cation diffusion facilitator CzcD-associated flavoprotein CzcO
LETQSGDAPMREPIRGEVDAVIVGAGFGGMYAIHKLRELGLTVQGFDKASDVGGTWYWNRYPGCRCDIPSLAYSYSWSPDLLREWTWSEKYATQPEILAYARFVADTYDLRAAISFETAVLSAVFDDATNQWTVTTDGGDRVTARYVVMATGCLSMPRAPEIAGVQTFAGETYHTGLWPQEGVDFTGQRVAVIGTGSSGIQSIPAIAEQARHLTVFQRTPNFSVPANNRQLSDEERKAWLDNYDTYLRTLRGTGVDLSEAPGAAQRAGAAAALEGEALRERLQAFWDAATGVGWLGFPQMLIDRTTNDAASDFVRGKIAERVRDPEVAAKLMPHDHPMGTKRICVDTGYFEVYNRDDVDLVDGRDEAIVAITPSGVKTTAGHYDVDAIVFATGFDAMTGALLAIDIRSDRCSLRAAWREGPKTYLGLMVAGLPNLFTLTGPGSPSVLSNMISSNEHHVEWVAETLGYMRENGLTRIEAQPEWQDRWVDHVNKAADRTLFPLANSWYIGANVPGKPRVFMAYVGPNYRGKVREVVEQGYKGFALA